MGDGLGTFLAIRALQGLPALLETPGQDNRRPRRGSDRIHEEAPREASEEAAAEEALEEATSEEAAAEEAEGVTTAAACGVIGA